MKLQVTIFLFCLIMATAAAYTVLTGCGCHFGGCICADDGPVTLGTWFPDGYSQILRSYVFGPSGLKDYSSATLRCKI